MSFWWQDVIDDREKFIELGVKRRAEDSKEFELWSAHSMESRMIDIWATADDFLNCYETYGHSDEDKLNTYAARMENLVTMACSDDSRGRGFAESVREAQWEVLNFAYGNNAFNHEGRTCMQWFDQFMYDINFELVH